MLNFIKTIASNFAFEIKRLSVNHQYHQKSLGLSDRLPFGNFIDPGILHNKRKWYMKSDNFSDLLKSIKI